MTSKNKSYTTKNYEAFRLNELNRQINEAHVRKLQQSIAEHGQLEPIRCNKDGVVIDGQHRLEALKRLDREVWVMVRPNLDMNEVVELNRARRAWNSHDYLRHFCKQKVEAYLQVDWLLDRYPDLRISDAIVVVCGKHVKTSVFHDGKLTRHTDCYKKLSDDGAFMSLIVRHCEHTNTRRTIYLFCNYDETAINLNLRHRLTEHLLKHKDRMLVPYTHKKHDILRALEDMCNYKTRSTKKLRLF